MLLLIYYVVILLLLNVVTYFVGLMVERFWGSQASLIIFLALYFLALWVAWIIAVRLTEPKTDPSRPPAERAPAA